MTEKKASLETQPKKKVEEAFFVEQEQQIDKTTILAIASILIALIIIAQIYSPAPIWAIFLIATFLILFLFMLLIITSLINSKKITPDDIKKTTNLILPLFVSRPIKHPGTQKFESQQYSEPLYTDYIFTEDGWKSVEETCAICKKPYAEFKHNCGAIFHYHCLNEYFNSLSEDYQIVQLCPHCYEPLIKEKTEELKVKWKTSELPEEEIEDKIKSKGLEFKEGETIIDKIDIDWLDLKNREKNREKK